MLIAKEKKKCYWSPGTGLYLNALGTVIMTIRQNHETHSKENEPELMFKLKSLGLQSPVLPAWPGHITRLTGVIRDFPLNILKHPVKTCFYYFKNNGTESDEKHRTRIGTGTLRWELKGWTAQCLPASHKVLRSVKWRGFLKKRMEQKAASMWIATASPSPHLP